MAVDWPQIRAGERAQVVRALQHLLNHHGASLEADGVFGPATEEALKQFQAARGLEADGIAGPAAWEALVVEVGLKDAGEAVRAAQTLLYVRGTLPTVDGEFGVRTDISVRRFQVFLGLPADGVMRPGTWRTLLGTGYVPMTGDEPGGPVQGDHDWRAQFLAKIRPQGPNFRP